MELIKAALSLKQHIEDTNAKLVEKNKDGLVLKNVMALKSNCGEVKAISMDSFTNIFVEDVLNSKKDTEAFVISDLAAMEVKDQVITYFLYKAYHKKLEKGLVFYQMINPDTMQINGDLQFSNLEENVFFKAPQPDFEESSCNAIETDNHTKDAPEIAFLIGHTNEERLSYDIQRLIIETAHNILKNPNVNYRFILQISVFGSTPSKEFEATVQDLEKATTELIEPAFRNAKFIFELEK